MSRSSKAFVLLICFLSYSLSVEEIDYEYIDESNLDASRRFFFGGNDAGHHEVDDYENSEPTQYQYDDTLPFGKLSDQETLTIEQFINALKKRKIAKEKQKKQESKATKSKQVKGSIKVNSRKKAKTPNKVKNGARNAPKEGGGNKLKSKPKAKNERHPPGQQTVKKTKTKQTPGKQVTKKTKNKTSSKTDKTIVGESAIKKKTTRRPKPFHKPKQSIKQKTKNKKEEEEDFFQIGNSNAEGQSDHHIHHHDHLEAHKHHHKHKESHSHSHDHSNDHVHNHKHTHNHVHNHIHKHNEAHEHTAEHSHTEKHHHKHLEYIDAGGWRRRNDISGGAIMDEVPTELIIENRSFKSEEAPEDNVKNYLKKYITFYRNAASNIDEENEMQNPSAFSVDNQKQDISGFSTKNHENEVNFMENDGTNKTSPVNVFDGFEFADDDNDEDSFDFQSFNFDEDTPSQILQLFNDEEEDDEDIEEISMEDFLALQHGMTISEENYRNSFDEEEDSQPSSDYSDDYETFEDQLGFGTNNNQIVFNSQVNDQWRPEANELVPIQEHEIDLNYSNQWELQSEIPLERSDEDPTHYSDDKEN